MTRSNLQYDGDSTRWMDCIPLARAGAASAATPADRLFAENLPLVPHMVMQIRRWQGVRVSDDDLQLGAMALMRSARAFDPARGVKFSTFACIAIKYAMFQQREYERRHPDRRLGEVEARLLADHCEGEDKIDRDDETRRLVKIAFQALTPRERQAIELRYFEGMLLADVGKVLGICKARVDQIIKRALKRAREFMAEHPAGVAYCPELEAERAVA